MEGNRQLNDAEVGRQVPARLGDLLQDERADLLGQLVELFGIKAL